MNTIRNLKQQEKYDKMLKRKNKEKNIYKSKNSTLRIEKMNLIKAVERKDKEIECLSNKLEIANNKLNMIKDNAQIVTPNELLEIIEKYTGFFGKKGD